MVQQMSSKSGNCVRVLVVLVGALVPAALPLDLQCQPADVCSRVYQSCLVAHDREGETVLNAATDALCVAPHANTHETLHTHTL